MAGCHPHRDARTSVAEGYCKAFVIESLDKLTNVGSTLPRTQFRCCCIHRHPSGIGEQVMGRPNLVSIIATLGCHVVHDSISFRCMEKSVPSTVPTQCAICGCVCMKIPLCIYLLDHMMCVACVRYHAETMHRSLPNR